MLLGPRQLFLQSRGGVLKEPRDDEQGDGWNCQSRTLRKSELSYIVHVRQQAVVSLPANRILRH
jgi:hypothetical protein